MGSITPIAQEFDVVPHVGDCPALADVQQPPHFFADGKCLLVADDDACMKAFPPEDFAM